MAADTVMSHSLFKETFMGYVHGSSVGMKVNINLKKNLVNGNYCIHQPVLHVTICTEEWSDSCIS